MIFSKPILLITFRRPEFTKIILQIIKKINPRILYIISDGPRNKNDNADIIKCRKIINSINWCKVKKKIFYKKYRAKIYWSIKS